MTNIKQKHDMFTMAEQSRIPLFLVGRLLIFKNISFDDTHPIEIAILGLYFQIFYLL